MKSEMYRTLGGDKIYREKLDDKEGILKWKFSKTIREDFTKVTITKCSGFSRERKPIEDRCR